MFGMFGITRKALFLSVSAVAIQTMPSFAGSDAVPVAQTSMQDVAAFEQKFFGHLYDKDTPDKRVQRLELLLFGATQDGEFSERLARVNQYVNEHANAPKAAQNRGSDNASLQALERKILKKTFDEETPAQRLARLESKVFGSASPAMSLGERVFRLKKTLNIETPSISGISPNSKMGDLRMMTPFSGRGITVVPFGMDGLGDIDGFGNGFGGGGLSGGQMGDLANQMNEMMNQLNRSLRSIHKMPRPGNPDHGAPPDATPFFNGLQGMQPFFNGQPGQPVPRMIIPQQRKDAELPPYLDPNSI